MEQKIICRGFLYHQGKTLLIQRSLTELTMPGFYELPGGKVDFGEDPEEALKREFREEVNMDVEIVRPYQIFSYVSEYTNQHLVEIVFLVRLLSDPSLIRLSEDHSDYQWVSVKDDVPHGPLNEFTKRAISAGFQTVSS
ncbi:NUDIX hydrolase [Thermoactinomyces sp. CICC 10522]|uniref:NUDIX hydrolase n=1 Tax=Thermoactinomyces sp. CICC 10522 TaxID=2767427 RepID=UPI0018DC86C3|nr:NUDIX hydrolase [Thermoactinomyces sp. CICC 10522]MBH8605036.1 NUDIX hydrolase [Thermoactinomyces sp. CICC 10522]